MGNDNRDVGLRKTNERASKEKEPNILGINELQETHLVAIDERENIEHTTNEFIKRLNKLNKKYTFSGGSKSKQNLHNELQQKQ